MFFSSLDLIQVRNVPYIYFLKYPYLQNYILILQFNFLLNILKMNQPDQKEVDNQEPVPQNPVDQQPQPEIPTHQVKQPQEEPQNMQDKPLIEVLRSCQIRNQDNVEPKDKSDENQKEGSPKADNDEVDPDDEEVIDGDDEKDGDDAGKGQGKQSSDSNRQDNDQSQLQTIGGKKCFNRLCNSKKIYKKIRSRVETQRYRFLCKNCYDNYVNNSFCEFCEQIYSNYENEEDDTKWVGCDKCQRWNHIQCERRYRHKNFQINKDKDTQYQCLACSKKNRNGPAPVQAVAQSNKRKPVQRVDYDGTRNYRTKIEINKDERIPIFHKKPESFPCLQSFLQTYNFRLWLNDANIRQDIEALRSTSRRSPLDEEPKKTKKVKLDY